MRGTAAIALLALVAQAGPLRAAGETDEESRLLARWLEGDPDTRRRLEPRLEEMERARRYAAARPVLVDFDGRAVPLAGLFEGILEPALTTPTQPQSGGDPGLVEVHRAALAALEALREAYAPPRPVRAGTLNLFLDYGARALSAPALPAHLRLRLFRDAMVNVRSLEGRVTPDARTAFLLHHRLLPPLLALARRVEGDATLAETVSEAASLLFLPSILDEEAQVALAPLTRGVHSRELLERFYRAGTLDDLGRVSLARSVAAQARDDAAFAAGAAPLLLELLADPQLPARERGEIAGLLLDRLVRIDVLRPTALDLLAVAFGGPPRTLEEYRALREEQPGALPLPQGQRTFRFLSVVLVREGEDRPPAIARVVRRDLSYYEPLRAAGDTGGAFVGVLVPDARGVHADLLGPPPGISAGKDIRLLRRPLRLERITVRTFGSRGEEIEVSATLPEDASEPVPAAGADLSHVVALLDARLRLTIDEEERRELVGLLVTIDTDAAREAALRHARGSAVVALLPLAERGHGPAAHALLAGLAELPAAERERALAAIAARRDAASVAELQARCRDAAPAVAALSAEALLAAGSAAGIEPLLAHPDKHVRACAGALALRLTPLAGSLRVTPLEPPDLERLAGVAERAFTKEDGESFARFGRWLALALRDPDEVRRLRREHKPLYLGRRSVVSWEFADAYTRGIREGQAKELWPALVVFLLDPHDPGAGLADRELEGLLDALEERATAGALRQVWTDALVVLACAQYGMEADPSFLDLADRRLEKLAGAGAPPRERRRAGVHWPLWAAAGPGEAK